MAPTADAMKRSDGIAGKVERACIDLMEATLLAPRVGAQFDAVVIREANGNRSAEVFIAAPPVLGPCAGAPPEGGAVPVRLACCGDIRDGNRREVSLRISFREALPVISLAPGCSRLVSGRLEPPALPGSGAVDGRKVFGAGGATRMGPFIGE